MQQPHERQILVSVGNRFVVFGSAERLPDHRQLGPNDVKRRYERVGDEREHVEGRIIDSLVIDGFTTRVESNAEFGDLTILDADGSSALVEIKTGDRDFAGLKLDQAWAELASAAENGERREIWAFNLERLGLGVVWSEGRFSPQLEKLSALSVWEFNPDGTVFDRQNIVDRLDDWCRRIAAVYDDVEARARQNGLAVRRDRTVSMSEELMQQFAVPDRELPILDLATGTTPVASFVPVGLWLIGFNGQINIITRDGTQKLVDRAMFPASPDWKLIDPTDKSVKPWNSDLLQSVLGLFAAHE